MTGSDVSGDEYARSAPYLHLLSIPAWSGGLRTRLHAALAGVTGPGPVLELGPGSGLGTETILAAVPHRPVLAAEPSLALRALLLARLSSMSGGDRVSVEPHGAENVPLPARLSAVVGMHMIGSLSPE